MITSGENLTEERFAKSRSRKQRPKIPFPADTNFVPGGNLLPLQIGGSTRHQNQQSFVQNG